MNIAVIAAAGWKGAGKDIGLVDTPAPFFPLGDDTTPLGRLCKQVRGFGFEPVIGMGKVGYPYCRYQPRGGYFTEKYAAVPIEVILAEIGVDPNDSPWTQERYAYAKSLGEVVQMPNPGWANQHDTFCEVMDTLGDWDKLLLVQGDMLFSSVLLAFILGCEPSFQFVPCPNHSLFVLDWKGATVYREYAEAHRKRAKQPAQWVEATQHYPDGPEGCGWLQQHGIASRGWNETRWRSQDTSQLWFDIDHGLGYQIAVERIKRRWYQ